VRSTGSSVKIPIKNLFYLLCYAWDVLEPSEITEVGTAETPDLENLMASVLTGRLEHLLRRGLERDYQEMREDSSCIRGRIDFQETTKGMLRRRGVKATIGILLKFETLSAPNRDRPSAQNNSGDSCFCTVLATRYFGQSDGRLYIPQVPACSQPQHCSGTGCARRRHLGLLVSLTIVAPSFHTTDLIKILGIGTVAIGFAFRDILQNFLAGILLLLHEPFRIEDEIKVDEFEGTVEAIETRATAIRTFDDKRIVIPNTDLFTKAVTVNTAYAQRRSEYVVGIGYGDDIDTQGS
jgi:Mechanosensitive ion channel/McrBC 5-methylcytosine restriction system component